MDVRAWHKWDLAMETDLMFSPRALTGIIMKFFLCFLANACGSGVSPDRIETGGQAATCEQGLAHVAGTLAHGEGHAPAHLERCCPVCRADLGPAELSATYVPTSRTLDEVQSMSGIQGADLFQIVRSQCSDRVSGERFITASIHYAMEVDTVFYEEWFFRADGRLEFVEVWEGLGRNMWCCGDGGGAAGIYAGRRPCAPWIP